MQKKIMWVPLFGWNIALEWGQKFALERKKIAEKHPIFRALTLRSSEQRKPNDLKKLSTSRKVTFVQRNHQLHKLDQWSDFKSPSLKTWHYPRLSWVGSFYFRNACAINNRFWQKIIMTNSVRPKTVLSHLKREGTFRVTWPWRKFQSWLIEGVVDDRGFYLPLGAKMILNDACVEEEGPLSVSLVHCE